MIFDDLYFNGANSSQWLEQQNLHIGRHLLTLVVRQRRQTRGLRLQQLLDRGRFGRIGKYKSHRSRRSFLAFAKFGVIGKDRGRQISLSQEIVLHLLGEGFLFGIRRVDDNNC